VQRPVRGQEHHAPAPVVQRGVVPVRHNCSSGCTQPTGGARPRLLGSWSRTGQSSTNLKTLRARQEENLPEAVRPCAETGPHGKRVTSIPYLSADVANPLMCWKFRAPQRAGIGISPLPWPLLHRPFFLPLAIENHPRAARYYWRCQQCASSPPI
jgi:hypothetical protein